MKTSIIENQTLSYKEFLELLKKYVKNNVLSNMIIRNNKVFDLPKNKFYFESRIIKGKELLVKKLKKQIKILSKQFTAEELEDDIGELYLKIEGNRDAFLKHERLKERLGKCFNFYFFGLLSKRLIIKNNIFKCKIKL